LYHIFGSFVGLMG